MSEPKSDRILIVDDTPRNIQVLGTILKDQGYQLNVAQNGKQALEVAAKVHPDLILLDIMMPEMDGFEACEHLQKDGGTKDIPVIFLTAKVETDDIVRGFELGAVDYVTKPFNPTELLARVETHLSLYHLKQHLEQLVDERTAEVQKAHRLLQQQVRELEARDRLVALQMKAPSYAEADEAVLTSVGHVLEIEVAQLYRPNEGGDLILRAAIGIKEEGVFQDEEALSGTAAAEAASIVARAFSESRAQAGEDEIAVPIQFDEDTLGAIAIKGLSGNELSEDAIQNTLSRLAGEAALVFNSAQMSQDLESGDIAIDALLNFDE